MSDRAALADFVRRALAAGHGRTAIRAAILEAGWTAAEAEAALEVWADTAFRPPVPRPRPCVSAREAFLYALMLVALATVVFNLTVFAFEAIDTVFPPGEPDPIGRSLVARSRGALAALAVFGPIFAALALRERRTDRRDGLQHRSLVRKWFSYGTLLVAALVLLADLVYVIYLLLGGTLALPTLLKIAVVAAESGAMMAFYRRDLSEDARPG
ncbi:MAG: hypothetical protein KDA73_08345 [Rhodobacteraceae bacterium]|nr:hypothetical protein [Paracoccaceae bacterium]